MSLRLFLVLIALTASSGCALNSVVLHPIDKEDFYKVKKNSSLTADRDGYFMSDEFFKEVLKAKVDKK